jgi:hypothetical protein
MKKKTLLILILTVCFISLFATAVSAQTFWDSILGPFEGFEEAYDKYFPFIDAIIYCIIFIGLAEWTIGKKFSGGYSSGKGGKAVVAGIGIIFAISLALWERTAGFNIKAFGPIAMGIFVAVMCLALYEGLKEGAKMGTTTAATISYTAFFFAMLGFGAIQAIADRFPGAKPLVGILHFVAFGAILLLVYKFLRGITGFAGGTPKEPAPSGQPPRKAKGEEAEEEAEEAFTLDERNLIKKIYEGLGKVIGWAIKYGGRISPGEKDKIRTDIRAELEIMIKEADRVKIDDAKVRRLARNIKRQARDIKELTNEEKRVMAYCDALKTEISDTIKMLKDVKAKFDKGGRSISAALPILRGKVPEKLREMWDALTMLFSLEEKIKKQLEGKA